VILPHARRRTNDAEKGAFAEFRFRHSSFWPEYSGVSHQGRKAFGRKKAQKAQKWRNTNAPFFAPFVLFCGHPSSGIFMLRRDRRSWGSGFVISTLPDS
jgi:hypothetical protein